MMIIFNEHILKKIGQKLLKRQEAIAVGESVTAGLLQFAFSNIPDAAKFLLGGLTAFNIGQKYKHLRVEPLHALEADCVSEKVAAEMAVNICGSFSSDWGIGVTGYASPVPQSGEKLFAFYAIIYKQKLISKGKIIARHRNPPEVQLFYVNYILGRLEKLISIQ